MGRVARATGALARRLGAAAATDLREATLLGELALAVDTREATADFGFVPVVALVLALLAAALARPVADEALVDFFLGGILRCA